MSCSSRKIVRALWLIQPPALHHWSNTENVLWNVYFYVVYYFDHQSHLKSLSVQSWLTYLLISFSTPLYFIPPPLALSRPHPHRFSLVLPHSCSHEANVRDGGKTVHVVFNPILHTVWLDNHALTLKSNSAKYYFHEKSRFLHTFLKFCCE